MTAFTSEGEGTLSTPVSVIYGMNCSLSYFGNITAMAKGNNSIELSWKPFKNSYTIDSYSVSYYDTWHIKRELHIKDGKKTSLIGKAK